MNAAHLRRPSALTLTREEVADELRIHPRHVWAYCERHEVLRAGLRPIRVNPNGKGTLRLLRAALVKHLEQGEVIHAGV